MFGDHKQRQKVVERWIAAVNSRDMSAIKVLVADDCLMIDSRGDSISGREDCLEAMRHFFALKHEYRIELDSIRTTSTETLMRGLVTAREPGFSTVALWRARSTRSHLLEWQSFSLGNPLGLGHILTGGKVQRERA